MRHRRQEQQRTPPSTHYRRFSLSRLHFVVAPVSSIAVFASRRGRKGLKFSRDKKCKACTGTVDGRGGRRPLCDPGSELRLGKRRKKGENSKRDKANAVLVDAPLSNAFYPDASPSKALFGAWYGSGCSSEHKKAWIR